jgi:CRP/FNR family transcriptional regulator, cyclic AMP receptor protein
MRATPSSSGILRWLTGMSERLWFLKQCDLFQQLSTEQLEMLESRCRARKFPRTSPIYLPAEQANGVLLLAEGRVKICSYTEEGKQAIMAFIEPGELFGELALLEPERRNEYAEAVEKSTIVLIPAEVVQQLIEENPKVSFGITKLFGLRRARVERRLRYLLFRSNRDRLIHLLLELAAQYGRQTAGGVELSLKMSHQDLASMIGSTRETVTVVLGGLQTEGHLKLGRRKIIIIDLARLAESVRSEVPRLENG